MKGSLRIGVWAATRLVACLLVLLSSRAWASEVYGLLEPDGVLSFTNVPTDSRYQRLRLPPERKSGAGLGQRLSRLPASHLESTIADQSRQHQLDPALIRAVIKAESDFDPAAISSAGAMGLMQLMPDTALKMDVRDPFNPEENIAGGVRYLRHLLDRFQGNLPLALAAYNAGAARVELYRALPPYEETRRYVNKVLRFYRLFADPSLRPRRSSRPSASAASPQAVSAASAR